MPGSLYGSGWGVEQGYAEAVRWVKEGAEQGVACCL
jgi:TPR repeat protein